MLEDDYQRQLSKLLAACECDVAVPSEWQDRLSRRGLGPAMPSDRRRFVRHTFPCRAILEMRQTLPAIPRRHIIKQVVTRDLSREGIGFLASQQLYPGERIALWLPRGKKNLTVVRCVEHGENCYEVGAVLAE
jgi:hypothetical protein